MSYVFLCGLSFSFVMIICSVRANEDIGLEVHLEDEKSLTKVVEGLKEL